MQYKVMPFVANIQSQEGAKGASSQLESLANQQAKEGWEYVRLENVETYIEGSSGCFGIGAQPGRTTAYSMVVFKK